MLRVSFSKLLKGYYKPCACGCKYLVKIVDKQGRIRTLKQGHNSIGETHPMWSGGIHPNYEGYIVCYAPNHPYKTSRNSVYLHRLVYEHYLYILFDEQIYIPKGIDIHHINGDIQDNSLINIEPLTRSYHGSISGKEGKGKTKTKGKKKTKRKYW